MFWLVYAIAHNAITPIRDPTTDIAGSIYKTHQPFIWVPYGCVPFPAVSFWGEISSGLRPGGRDSDGCRKSDGQIYTRGTYVDCQYGIMYAVFVPKDQQADNFVTEKVKYTWLPMVVWVSNTWPKVSESISYWDVNRWRWTDDWYWNRKEGERPYMLKGFRCLLPIDVKGGEQPMVHWDHLPPAAREALEEFKFGHEVYQWVPFNERYFAYNMNEANKVKLEKKY